MLSTKVQKYMVLDKKNVISLRKNIYLCKLLTNYFTMKKLNLLLLSLLFTFAAYADGDRACQAPTNVKVTVQENDPGYSFIYKTIISWDAVEGAEGYVVYCLDGTYELGLTNSLFYIAGSDNTGILDFQVKTICSTGEYSEASETVEAFIGPQNNCPAPTSLYATVEEGTEYDNVINITWDAVAEAETYSLLINGEEYNDITETSFVYETNEYGLFEIYLSTECASGPSNQSYIALEIIDDDISIEEYENKFNIYPNPVNDRLMIETNEKVNAVNIYNLLGVAVYSTNNFVQNEINVSGLLEGVYFISIKTDKGEIVKRFIKK